MTTTYTDNFSFPLLSEGSDGWEATINGMILDIDIEIKAAQTPIMLMTGEMVVSRRLGEVILKHFDNQ